MEENNLSPECCYNLKRDSDSNSYYITPLYPPMTPHRPKCLWILIAMQFLCVTSLAGCAVVLYFTKLEVTNLSAQLDNCNQVHVQAKSFVSANGQLKMVNTCFQHLLEYIETLNNRHII